MKNCNSHLGRWNTNTQNIQTLTHTHICLLNQVYIKGNERYIYSIVRCHRNLNKAQWLMLYVMDTYDRAIIIYTCSLFTGCSPPFFLLIMNLLQSFFFILFLNISRYQLRDNLFKFLRYLSYLKSVLWRYRHLFFSQSPLFRYTVNYLNSRYFFWIYLIQNSNE